MWEREELKERARQGLSRYYGIAILVVIVTGLLGGGISTGGGVKFSITKRFGPPMDANGFFDHSPFRLEFLLFFFMVLLMSFFVSLIFSVFVSNVVEAGKCRYFTMSTLNGDDAGFGELFGCFRSGRYFNTVKVQFLRKLYESLWTMLLIIPGIIKHYEYYMVPYLIAEFPDMDSREVFRLSREMMDGNKIDTFILELSFMGWRLLGLLACGVGILFEIPYEEATYGELYLKLRELRLGVPRWTEGDRYEGNGRPSGTHRPDRDGAVYTQPGTPEDWSRDWNDGRYRDDRW